MKTVLVVEDEYDLLATLRAILEGEGYATRACTDGKEALERIRSEKPDLLLMDMMLPRVSGEAIARTMRSDPELDRIPVVLMSAAPPGDERQTAHCRAFLRKPFSLTTLLDTVRSLIGRPEANHGGR
jgi:two-component system phosphate regulon response regulator PhoB